MALLFSYGTLRDSAIQLTTFGRLLAGEPDELVGFEALLVRVDDANVVAMSGTEYHTIVRFNGRAENRVPGMVLELTADELAAADAYEPAGYTRIATTLASGKLAWVYADAGGEDDSITRALP